MLTFREIVIIALFAAFVAFNTKAEPELDYELVHLRVLNRHYAALIAACLNGRTWAQGDQMVFCDRQYTGVGR